MILKKDIPIKALPNRQVSFKERLPGGNILFSLAVFYLMLILIILYYTILRPTSQFYPF